MDKDTIFSSDSIPLTQKEIDRLFWKPDPMRAVWLGAVLPGAGQIYNRSYWKLPIVYGGFMGCIYAITWTNTGQRQQGTGGAPLQISGPCVCALASSLGFQPSSVSLLGLPKV